MDKIIQTILSKVMLILITIWNVFMVQLVANFLNKN